MSDLRRSPKSDGIEVQFETTVTIAHASKTKIANASKDKKGSLRSHYPTHQTASFSERIIASGGIGANRRSSTGLAPALICCCTLYCQHST